MLHRSQFVQEQIQMTTERLTTYRDIIATESTNLERLEAERVAAQEDIAELEAAIT